MDSWPVTPQENFRPQVLWNVAAALGRWVERAQYRTKKTLQLSVLLMLVPDPVTHTQGAQALLTMKVNQD